MSNDKRCGKPSVGDGDAPSCWICLEEGPDESGKPLVRDCSCRGDAGFSHVTCIIQYAKTKSLDFLSSREEQDTMNFVAPWQKCPHCHQKYQHKLAIDLANSLLSFMDEKFPRNQVHDQVGTEILYFCALRVKIVAITTMNCRSNPLYASEGKRTAFEALALAQKITTRAEGMGREAETFAHEVLGFFLGEADGNWEEGIKHYEHARDIWMLVGNKDKVKMLDTRIGSVKARINSGGIVGEAGLKSMRKTYETYFEMKGENATQTIESGMNLAAALHQCEHGIECERLIRKMVSTSVRVYGAEHDIAKQALARLHMFTTRCVMVKSQPPAAVFIALRYDATSDQYIVMDSVEYKRLGFRSVPRDRDSGETIRVDSNNVFFQDGTPVVCHGLKNASHLNGKIGDARGYNHTIGRFEVHFEETGLKPVKVRRENLRILFELPN